MTINGGPLGSTPLGYGPFAGQPLVPVGPPSLTAYRDPAAKNFAIDPATLQQRGTSPARAVALVVMQTVAGTSLRGGAGIRVPQKIGESFNQTIATEVHSALRQAQIRDRLLSVDAVFVKRYPLGRVTVGVRFHDLTTGRDDEVEVDAS